MKRSSIRVILFLILALITLSVLFVQYIIPHATTNIPNEFYKTPILGGFSINSPEMAMKAAADGIQVAVQYGSPSESDRLGQKLESLHMKVIDAYISSYLYYYECHRTKELKPTLLGPGQYCKGDPHPELTDANVLLDTIAAYLKQVKDNQLIIGYWVLDDWPQWDAGSARQLLIKIHDLIKLYTPDRPAICGFGGSIGPYQEDGWDDWVAANFSPQGCDMVGFYIYAPTLPNTTPTSSPDVYDWSMSTILPAMFASLQQRGWNIRKEPLIAIGQAFGGPIIHTNDYWVTPSAKDIEVQSKSFCEHGATGLTFYGWDDSEFGPTAQTPMNSPQIEMGIRNGIAACKQYWSNHP